MILKEMKVLLLRSHLDALVHVIDREVRKDILQGEEIAGAVPCEPLGVRLAMGSPGAERLRDEDDARDALRVIDVVADHPFMPSHPAECLAIFILLAKGGSEVRLFAADDGIHLAGVFRIVGLREEIGRLHHRMVRVEGIRAESARAFLGCRPQSRPERSLRRRHREKKRTGEREDGEIICEFHGKAPFLFFIIA